MKRVCIMLSLAALSLHGVGCQEDSVAPPQSEISETGIHSSVDAPGRTSPVMSRTEALPDESPSDLSESEAWCRVSGVFDSIVTCPIQVSTAPGSAPATGLQLTMTWTAADLTLEGIESEVCPPGGLPCATLMAPPAKNFGALGHSVAMQPQDLKTANGKATVMLYHASTPDAALNGALGHVVFKARRDLADAAVSLQDLVATGPEAQTLSLKVSPTGLIVSP